MTVIMAATSPATPPSPKWACDNGLVLANQQYEGIVDDYSSVLSQHCMECVTTYGVRKSRKNVVIEEEKENNCSNFAFKNSQDVRLYWQKTEGGRVVQFNGTPFLVAETKLLECQFGPKYFKQKPVKGKRLWLQGSRKSGCPAQVEVKKFVLFPEFSVSERERSELSSWKLRSLQEEQIKAIKEKLRSKKFVKTMIKFFVSFPKEEQHLNHPTGRDGVFAQKLNPEVSQKIVDMVRAGITDIPEVKRSLKYYVDTVLVKKLGTKPVTGDRAFYPTNLDIRNHVGKAKRALELSKYDQENLRLKIEEWKKYNDQSSFFFRPFRDVPDSEQSDLDTSTNCTSKLEESLLFVHQEDWQKELMVRYGNTVTLMDATYKTTKYSIPLFFVCVKTNVSYSVVAEFVTQYETSEHIYEALSILKTWNPNWNPEFYLTDYSDAEIAAVNKLFPNTTLYLCEFHREQAWERWVKERKHGLSEVQGATLLDLLRDCANAPPNWTLHDKPCDYYYHQTLSVLKSSDIWNGNDNVQQWLTNKWLSCPKMWARAYRDQTYHAAINTTNGVESQNKLLKYSYLPRKKNITLSQLVMILYDDFLPESHQKYLYLNYHMSDKYRSYNNFVPSYLQGRPRSVIIHCLDRKSSSRKYSEEDILSRDKAGGRFTIRGSNKVHTVDFGKTTGQPSCTCPDWMQWQIPCKHFFCIFELVNDWGWASLPEVYTNKPYLCADHSALEKQPTDKNSLLLPDQGDGEGEINQDTSLGQCSLPSKEPSYCKDLKHERQAVRIALKEIESLSFNVEKGSDLRNLASDLRSLLAKHEKVVNKDHGIVVRPVPHTNTTERAYRLKKRYKQMSRQASLYKSLQTKEQRGRPRLNSSYRNRVGKKATCRRKEINSSGHLMQNQECKADNCIEGFPASLSSDGEVKKLTAIPPTHQVEVKSSESASRKRPRGRCGVCSGCRRSNCGQCTECCDMKCFGGPGVKKKACRYRKCVTRFETIPKSSTSTVTSHGSTPLHMSGEHHPAVNKKFMTKEELLKAVASPNYFLPPGVTIPASLVPISPPPSTITHPGDFLKSQSRRAFNVSADGNCMFTSLAHQLYGSVEHHLQLRHALYEQIQRNYATYEPYWIEDLPHGRISFADHLAGLAKPGTWGSHVELQAISDRFNVDVFVCSPNPSGIVRWEKKAIPRHHKIFVPPLPVMPTFPFTLNHLELLFGNSHYQSVVPAVEGTKLSFPLIIARNSDCIMIH